MPDAETCPGGEAPEAVPDAAAAGGGTDRLLAKRLNYVFRRAGEDPAALDLLRQILAYRTKG
jgi:hypothetical protein